MRSRYRVEIYDEIKSNDLTIYSDENLDRQALSQIVFSHLNKFKGNVRAYVFDQNKKIKTSAAFYPMGYKIIKK
jgi:hypothetical protein